MKLFFILSIFFALNINIFAQEEWVWKQFSPSNQYWSILAPGSLKPDAEALDPNSKKGSYSFNDYHGFFAVIYRDSPRRYVPWKPDYDAYMKRVRDDVVQANNGEIIKEIEFSSRGVKGREVQVKFPSGTTRGPEGEVIKKYRVQRFRMFFIGTRFYVVLAVLPENEIDSPVVDRYLNSFIYNTPPVANADFYSIDEDTTLNVSASRGVLANDADAEKDLLIVSADSKPLTAPAHGSLTLNADGSFTYQPAPNFNGKDSFTYKSNDGLADSNVATVTITVNPVNDPPTISVTPASVTVDELTPVTLKVTADDIDSPISSLRFSLSGAPVGAAINPQTGVFSWIPDEAQGPGNYTFKVNVSDGEAITSATVNVIVREVNVAPQFVNAPIFSIINELEPYSFNIQAVDTDIPKQTLTYSLVGAPQGAAINPATGLITWTPTEAQGDGSTYKFAVRVSDGVVSSEQPINLVVKEVNSPPSLEPISDRTIDELKSFSLLVKGTDSDIPANHLTYSLDSGAPSGMTINSKTGEILWTPDESQGPGDYSVTVRVTDDGTPPLSDSRTFKIHVNEVNVAPKLDVIGNKTIDEENLLTFTVKATDADLPANRLEYTMINAPAGASIDSASGVFKWTPTEAQGPGTYTVTFRVTDNGTPSLSDQQTMTITVNEVNKAPVAENAAVSLDEDTTVLIFLKATDVDLPANKLTYSIVSNPAHGILTGTDPNLIYQPNPDFNGSDSFTFKANDGSLDSNTATVSINVRPVNDAPVARPDNATTVTDVPVIINVIANDSDVDGDQISLVSVSNAVNGKAEIVDDKARFTPNPQFQGIGSFSYTISDGQGGTATGIVTVTVNPAKPKN
ncbi:MAG: Ig-like domain-containing protein [Pyrinomonadaceae bacterium]